MAKAAPEALKSVGGVLGLTAHWSTGMVKTLYY